MTFLQRVGNTMATYLVQWIRDYFMMNRLEDVIDYHFPGSHGRPRGRGGIGHSLAFKSVFLRSFQCFGCLSGVFENYIGYLPGCVVSWMSF